VLEKALIYFRFLLTDKRAVVRAKNITFAAETNKNNCITKKVMTYETK